MPGGSCYVMMMLYYMILAHHPYLKAVTGVGGTPCNGRFITLLHFVGLFCEPFYYSVLGNNCPHRPCFKSNCPLFR